MAKKKTKNKKKKLVIWLIILSIITIFVILKMNEEEPLTVVEISTPQLKTIEELITANGKIQPEIEIKIAPEVSGEIVQLAIKEGDYVNKGDLLIQIRPDTYISMKDRAEAGLASSQAQLEQIKAQLKQALSSYKRQKKLFKGDAISESDFETALSQYESLKAQRNMSLANINVNKAQLKQSIEDLQKTTIYAPSSGTVSMLSVELGERVVGTATMAGTEMLRLADLSKMEVRAEVNENDIVKIEMGDSAKIEVDAYLNRVFDGIVTRIANSSIASNTGQDQVTSYEVLIQILPQSYSDLENNNQPSPFRPGMNSTANITTEIKTTVTVPIQSVTTRIIKGNKKQLIFEYNSEEGIVETVFIETGIQDKEDIEVLSELNTEKLIVVAPFSAISKQLNDSTKVSVNEKSNEENSEKNQLDKTETKTIKKPKRKGSKK